MKTNKPSSSRSIRDHRNLKVWIAAVELATDIYTLTNKLPSEEKYGLCSQIRRAAVSVASNIAEGAARGSRKEFIRFLYIASGSVTELETQLIIVEKTELIPGNRELLTLQEKLFDIKRMIHGLTRALKN
jgi:four helix bundle protein